MSHSARGECDDKIKNMIYHLYKVKNLPLQGSDLSVKEIMKQKYGFDRTKQQYEKLLADWGFTKKRRREDYQTIEWTVQKRSKMSKASAVYLDGKLLPVKAWRRQGSMTAPERMKLDQELPETPTGFEIRTPTAQPLCHLDFWNLPILHFQSGFNIMKDKIEVSEKTFEKLMPVQRGLEKSTRSTFMPLLRKLLPLEALRDEPAATSLAIDRVESLCSNEFLALTVYLMSNNFFGESNGCEAYKWLRARGKTRTSAIIQMIASVDGFTSKALLENIFRLAVEAGDTATVEALLKAGVKPNGHRISHKKIPDTMDPLQYACVTGNFEMAQMLIKTGWNVQILESKDELSFWKRSLIVLSIIGEKNGFKTGLYESEISSRSYLDDDDVGDDDFGGDISERDDGANFGTTSNRETNPSNVGVPKLQQNKAQATFLEFIRLLINEGARVNVDSAQDYSVEHFESGFPLSLSANHSPLTAASKYRHNKVVRLLLDNGADIEYLVDGETNALQECLSSAYVFEFNYHLHVKMFKARSFRNESLPEIVRDLVNAGVDINTSSFYGCNSDDGYCICRVCLDFSPMDLAVFTGMTEVLGILFDAGAEFSTHCLQYATLLGSLDMVEWLLEHGATMPYKPKNIFRRGYDDATIKEVLKRCSDRSTKRLAMLIAIKLDSASLMDFVLTLGPFDWTSLFEFPDLLSRLFEELPWDIFLDLNGTEMEVISKILALDFPSILELWQHLNLLVNNILEKYPGNKQHFIRKKYGELARNAVKRGIPMQVSKNCCTETCQYQLGEAMLIIAVQIEDLELIELLLDDGVNMNAYGKIFCGIEGLRYQTPLTTALVTRSWESFSFLLKAGANVNNPVSPPGHFKNLALCAAISEGYAGVFQRYLDVGAKLDLESVQLLGDFRETGHESFEFHLRTRRALIENHDLFSIVFAHLQGLLECPIRDPVTQSMISIAVEAKDPALLGTILGILKQTLTSSLPSTTQALGEMLNCCHEPDLRILNLLLDAGANANGVIQLTELEYKRPYSILHIAIRARCYTIVEAILKAGGDLNGSLQPEMDSTVLQMAIAVKDNDIICLLLEYGADPDTSSPYQSQKPPGCWGTPLQMAVEKAMDESVRILLDHKADPERTNSFVAHTPLQISARKGLESILSILIENGANVNAPPDADHGGTALQYAVIGGFFGIAYILVQNGADVNAAGAEIGGRTALEAAAEHGRIDIVRYLLNVGAEVHGSGQQQYKRALDFATGNGHHSIRELLEEYHG